MEHVREARGLRLMQEDHSGWLGRVVAGKRVYWGSAEPSADGCMGRSRGQGTFRERGARNGGLGGSSRTSGAIKSGEIRICRNCPDIVREFSLYRWDESAKYDAVKKENDHAMDDMRYFVSTVLQSPADDFFAVAIPRERRC